MAATEVDVGYMATHLAIPQDDISTVATAPTAELVQGVLAAVAQKLRQLDTLEYEKSELQVFIETKVRGAESQRDQSNERAKQALKDVEEARRKLQQEETTRQVLENELQTIKSSTSTSQSEIDSLHARIASLETSNRESLRIIDSKNTAHELLAQELQAQHQKNMKLSQEIAALRQSESDASSRVNSAKFREQSLTQQLEAAQRDVEYYQKELSTKAGEALKYRKEKGARIADLERQNEDQKSTIDSLKRTDDQLRQRLDAAQKKADEAFAKVQQLQETAARHEEDFRQESDGLKRLVDLKEQQTVTHKNRVVEVETREEQVKRECEDKIRRVSEELARATTDKDEFSQANESLQAEVGRLEAIIATGSRNSPAPGSAPQTPRPRNSSFGPGSPMATPGTLRKSLSATQAIEEYYKIKGILNVEKKRSKNLESQLDEVIEQLEAKGPEIEELQAENVRFQQELRNMSELSDESFRERDAAKKAARKAESAASNAQAEIKILRHQLRDAGAQIQMLTYMQLCLEKGFDQLTAEEALHIQKLERGQAEGEEASGINEMILQHLAVFKDVRELQQKNEELLRMVHELGESMENEEQDTAKQQAAEDHKENAILRQKLAIFQDELSGLKVRADSIMKERDMFRRIVESRASADEIASALGGDGVLASIEANSTMNEDTSDMTATLRNIEQNFESYRVEQSVDRKTMREQIEKLSAEKNSLQAEVSRLSSQLSLAAERHEMLQSNFTGLQSENKELHVRNQHLSDSAAKQDVRTQQVAEDLVETRGLMESMRNENANLKAEKKLWKEIQERLNQDNENLMQERSHLNAQLATMRSLGNERELSDAETKRRLETQIETLDAEVNSTKRKLADEVEEAKKAQLRKEFDSQQSQKRIDELSATIGQLREELVATKTSRDHLQSRVDELTIQLRSAEERAERLQPRPTPRPAATAQDSADQDSDERIQELVLEVTDLKRDLELAKSQLENAQAQAERYRELSQASEEALERVNSAQDQFAQEMEARVTEKDAKVKELEQQIADVSGELSRSNTELSALRDAELEAAHRLEDEKAILNAEIKRLKDEEERYIASAQFHQQDLRAQADIATNAQQAYENEVMKHGEAAKTLSNLRAEYNLVKTSVATWKAEAESAKATLLQNENSWEEQRQNLEREVVEIRARRDDANAQNKLLHQQLESVTGQITALQQNRASAGESLEAIAAQPSSTDADNLRELSNYLRREKEILEVQNDLKVQEAKRLQTQLDYTQAQLDEASLKLEQERQSRNDSQRSTMAHKDLMNKLEELNLYRESSAALRAESRQAQAQLAEQATKVASLEASIQPLEAQIEELQSQQSFKEAELKQLQADRDRWQKRTEDIIAKRGSTDPAEVEELKQKVENLEKEQASLQETEAALRQKVQELEATLAEKEAAWAVSRERLINSAKEKARTLMAQKNEVIGEKDRLQQQFDETSATLSTTQEELKSSKKERDDFQQQVNAFQQQVATLQEEAKGKVAPEAPATAPTPAEPATTENSAELEAQLASAREALEKVTTEKATIEAELQSVRHQLETTTAEKDQATAEVNSHASNGDSVMHNGEGGSNGGDSGSSLSDEERKSLEEKLATAEAKVAELEAKISETEEHISTTIKTRSDKMKEALNKKLKEAKASWEEEKAHLEQEKDKAESEFKLRMEQERKIWEVENAGQAPNGNMAPGTPTKQQAPSTPQTATPAIPDIQNLGDKEVRDMISSNPTLKSIVQNNIRQKLAQETKKLRDEIEPTLKTEWEQKVEKAKESTTQLLNTKYNLKLNMAEKRALAATFKCSVVEKAAQETPQRAVVEVWAEAKNAKPPPAQPAQPPSQTPGTPATPKPAAPVSNTPAGTPQAPVPQAAPATPIPGAGQQQQQPPQQQVVAGEAPKPATNPFASSTQQTPQAGAQPANPFSASQQSAGQAPAATANTTSQPSQLPQPKTTGIPVPRKPSGPHQNNTGRGGARGGGAQRGGRGGGRASLNASAENFQPGNKRPRGDSEAAGNGPKRARGGGGQH